MQATLSAPVQSQKTEETLLTAEEYYATCRLKHTELIDGKVVELSPPGFDHGEIAGTIVSRLRDFVKQNKLGRVSVEGGFRLQSKPAIVRAPDVSFVETARLQGVKTRGFIDGAPTLAVEVVSPGDLWPDVEKKVQLYLDKGTRAVWIVEPDAKTVQVRTKDKAPFVLHIDDILDGGEVLSGFQLPLREIFE